MTTSNTTVIWYKRTWVRNLIIVLILAAITAGCILGYKHWPTTVVARTEEKKGPDHTLLPPPPDANAVLDMKEIRKQLESLATNTAAKADKAEVAKVATDVKEALEAATKLIEKTASEAKTATEKLASDAANKAKADEEKAKSDATTRADMAKILREAEEKALDVKLNNFEGKLVEKISALVLKPTAPVQVAVVPATEAPVSAVAAAATSATTVVVPPTASPTTPTPAVSESPRGGHHPKTWRDCVTMLLGAAVAKSQHLDEEAFKAALEGKLDADQKGYLTKLAGMTAHPKDKAFLAEAIAFSAGAPASAEPVSASAPQGGRSGGKPNTWREAINKFLDKAAASGREKDSAAFRAALGSM